MNSLQTMNNDLTGQLRQLGLARTARELDDLIARATKQQWSPLQLIEAIAKSESADRASRNLDRRLKQARLGRFKPIADFDWDWPQKIDRELVERALKLSLIEERRNLILMGANGLGKTCIAKNIAYTAITAGKSVIFRTASELISDLSGESSQQRQRRLRLYSRVDLLCIDEVGYLAYDAGAADLLYEVIARRYEEGALILTTNRAFKEWNEVFPHATCIATMLDRLLHHADVIVVEGHSYRVRESELEATARRKKK
ncbi:MAG TPA: IS21-like element helper ATPase IstB [Blastocatellia bacterium]|nr:IS21-like element helper ATPase IstB [Blastocatellia bacterium]